MWGIKAQHYPYFGDCSNMMAHVMADGSELNKPSGGESAWRSEGHCVAQNFNAADTPILSFSPASQAALLRLSIRLAQ